MEDDRCRRSRASTATVSSSAARVWMTSGLPQLAASAACASEELALRVARRVVAVVVEAGLADGDGPRMREQLAQRVERSASASPAWCGWMPSAAKTPSSRSASASVAPRRSRSRCRP